MEEGLVVSNEAFKADNNGTVANIAKAASDQGNKEQDVAVANTAQQYRAKTQEILSYIDDMQKALKENATGGNLDKARERSVLKKYEEPSNYMVEKRNAYELKDKLDTYNQEMLDLLSSQQITRNWKTLALNANEMELYKDNPEERKKDFAELNFYKTPLASTLAQLTFFQNQIYSRESDALSALGAKVGAESVVGFDVITGTVQPLSNVVTAGTEFEADVFLTASNSALAPEMKMGNTDLTVENGRGKIKFKASARDNEYDENGLATKSFKATITYKDGGEDKTLEVNHEYSVAKPTIRVGLNAVSALYLNCSNNLKIEVPSLGPAYRPSFNVTGGSATAGAKPGDVMINPAQRNIKIGVSSSGIFIDNVEFTARRAPLPTFKLQINGKDYDPKQGLSSAPASVNLLLIPDAEFKAAYPRDARYFVTKGQVQLARGRQAVRVIPINGRTFSVDLAQIRAQARKGDRIVVEVQEITRFNFEDQPEKFTFADQRVMSIN